MPSIDTLFVINQNSSLEKIKEQLQGVSSAVILSTHYLYEYERVFLGDKVVAFICFADFLSDEEMSNIDKGVSERLLNRKVAKNIYNSQFMRQVLIDKNILVHEKIYKNYQFEKVIAADGLGIVKKIWEPEFNEKCQSKLAGKFSALLRLLNKISNFITKRLYLSLKLYLIEYKNNILVFSFLPKRLDFVSEIKIYPYTIQKLFALLKNEQKNVQDILEKQFPGKDLIFCNTLHNQQLAPCTNEMTIWMFQDGYYPSNYSRSYLDSLDCDAFICNSPFAKQWLCANGINAQVRDDLLKPIKFHSTLPSKSHQNFLLLAGHGGDWCALINRSDTDKLFEAFALMAKAFPEYNFRIRLHPTMTHPSHEGPNSAIRIKKYVDSLHYDNLTVSNDSLEEDLEWADFCISEYSNVLFTALAQGKPTLFVNLTNRRSFMAELEQFGFASVDSAEKLRDALKRLPELIQQNNVAIDKINKYFEEQLEKKD